MRSQILIVAIVVMIGYPMCAYSDEGAVSCLARLRELGQQQSVSSKELAEAIALLERIRSDTARGDRAVSGSLLSIVEAGMGNVIGPLALPVACEKQDAQGADQFVEFINRLVEDIQNSPPTNKDRSTIGATSLVSTFFGDCATSIAGRTTQPRRLLDLVIEATTTPTPILPPDVRQKALLLIAESPIAPVVRKEYALRFISLQRNESAPDGFAHLFAAEDFSKLRALIRPPNDGPDSFSYGAADVLAHHGDRAALPDLIMFLDQHAVGKPTPEGMIRWNIWQIEMQHPPSGLVEYIRGADQRAGEYGRIWAMRRAIELQVDKEVLRDAVLEYAGHEMAAQYSLSSLKKAAIECGVLSVNDLPNVVVMRGAPTP